MAQGQVETKAPEGDGGESLRFSVSLVNLQGGEPVSVEFDKNASLEDMGRTINAMLKLNNEDGLRMGRSFPTAPIPNSFAIKVGSSDVIDFAQGMFTIAPTTRLISYYNDFLDEAKLLDEEKANAEQTEGEVRFDGTLKAQLKSDSSLVIGDARIQFQRTLRIPDDGKTYPLPPSLGAFPCVKVQDHVSSKGLPDSWRRRKGVVVPMWQREAMWMSFSASKACAIKVGVGKINAVTGKAWRSKNIAFGKAEQNYCPLPKQLWLDGINAGNGYIRQFVAMPLGKGYTVEVALFCVFFAQVLLIFPIMSL